MMVATSTTPSVTERYSFAIPFWAASAISTTTSRSVTPSAPDWRFQDHAQKDEQGDVHDRAAHDHLGDGMRRHDQLPPADVEQHGAHRSTSSRVTAHVPAPSQAYDRLRGRGCCCPHCGRSGPSAAAKRETRDDQGERRNTDRCGPGYPPRRN